MELRIVTSNVVGEEASVCGPLSCGYRSALVADPECPVVGVAHRALVADPFLSLLFFIVLYSCTQRNSYSSGLWPARVDRIPMVGRWMQPPQNLKKKLL